MKKITLLFFLNYLLVTHSLGVQAQVGKEQLLIEEDLVRKYYPENVGNFSGAMKSCFNNYRIKNYFSAYQTTVKIINQMTPLERNQAMGNLQYVLRTRTFNGRSLTAAECERLISSDWPSYLLESS
jgi:hypothetical protein